MKTSQTLLEKIQADARQGLKSLAVLIDPDKEPEDLQSFVLKAEQSGVKYFLVGGSLLFGGEVASLIERIKTYSSIPVVIFPGSPCQISDRADALLFLSLISGRNPDLLIGRHVEAAPVLKKLGIEVIPTGYMLVDCGVLTTAHYISQSFPLPNDKPDLAVATALAGVMLGMQVLYLDGGSGAVHTVNPMLVRKVKEATAVPLLVGGGIQTEEQARSLLDAGADILVVGTLAEKNFAELEKIGKCINHYAEF